MSSNISATYYTNSTCFFSICLCPFAKMDTSENPEPASHSVSRRHGRPRRQSKPAVTPQLNQSVSFDDRRRRAQNMNRGWSGSRCLPRVAMDIRLPVLHMSQYWHRSPLWSLSAQDFPSPFFSYPLIMVVNLLGYSRARNLLEFLPPPDLIGFSLILHATHSSPPDLIVPRVLVVEDEATITCTTYWILTLDA